MADKVTLLSALENPMTMNAIAKKVFGVSKPNNTIKTMVADLISSGQVSESNDSRGFVVYTKVAATSSSKDVSGATISQSSIKKIDAEIPSLPTSLIPGYSVKVSGNELVVSCPNNKNIKMSMDEYLLVLNDVPSHVVKTANDVLACIREFTTNNGMQNFLVTDMVTNKSIGQGDIILTTNKILSLKVSRHNKAG